MREEPEQQAKRGAEHETGNDGKVKRGVLAPMEDIAGKSAQTEWKFAAEIKQRAYASEYCTKKKQQAAEITIRVH